jgi:hypothetical protein
MNPFDKSRPSESGSGPASAAQVALDGSTVRVNIRDLFPDGVAAADGEPREHVLVVTDGAGRGQSIRLGAEPVVIGRAAPAELILPDTRVSRSHCEVRLVGNDAVVTDRGSTNGSFIGKVRVDGTGVLARDGALRVGDHLLRHRHWTRREIEEWERLNVPEPVFAVDIEIDEARRRLEVQEITGSELFRDIVTEIERIRGHDAV